MLISGSVVLITGGAKGLGKGFAGALLERGAKVCFVDVDVVEGRKTEKQFHEKFGPKSALFVKCDVTNDDDVRRLFEGVITKFGFISIMVNNAGIMNEVTWERTIQINLIATIRFTNLAIEHMRKDKGGRGGLVVNVSSTSGLFPTFFMPSYAASKLGVVGFTRSWADNPLTKDHFGIHFACLCPGSSETTLFRGSLEAKNPPLITFKENRETINRFVLGQGVNSVEAVVAAFVQLVEKVDNNGAVVTVDPQFGTVYRYRKHPTRL